MKKCPKCSKIKKEVDFYRDKSKKDGFRTYCKVCCKVIHGKYREKNKEEWTSRTRKWQAENRQKYLQYNQEYGKKNRKELNQKDRKRCENVCYKLRKIIRKRLWSAIKNSQKSGSGVDDLGCSIEELKQHLESKFQLGMTWKNYGLYGWHIDHIKPLASFNLTSREQFLEACHYTNLQPLWAKENLRKKDKL